jgi:hypothetical protein
MEKKKRTYTRRPKKIVTTEELILKELQEINKVLQETQHIMDGIWRERRPD